MNEYDFAGSGLSAQAGVQVVRPELIALTPRAPLARRMLLHELFMKYDALADHWGVYKVGLWLGSTGDSVAFKVHSVPAASSRPMDPKTSLFTATN